MKVTLLFIVICCCLLFFFAEQLVCASIKSKIVSTLVNKKDAIRNSDLIETGNVLSVNLRKGVNGEEDLLIYSDRNELKGFGLTSKNVSTLYSATYVSNCYQLALNPLNSDEIVLFSITKLLKLNIKTGKTVTLAGTGVNGYNGDNIMAVNAQIGVVSAITYNSMGELIFSDATRIRKILLNGTIVTIAGNGKPCDDNLDGRSNIPATSAIVCFVTAFQHVKFASEANGIEWLYFRDRVGIKRINPYNGQLEIILAIRSTSSAFHIQAIQENPNSFPVDLWLSDGIYISEILDNTATSQPIAGGGTDQASLIIDARSGSISGINTFAFDYEKNELFIGSNGRIIKYVKTDSTIRHVIGCLTLSCPMNGINMDGQLSTITATKPSITFDENRMYYSDVSMIKIMDLNTRFIKDYISHSSFNNVNQIIKRNGSIYIHNIAVGLEILLKYNESSRVLDKIAGGSAWFYSEGAIATENSIAGLVSFNFNENGELIMSYMSDIRNIRNDRIYTIISDRGRMYDSTNSSFTQTYIDRPSQLFKHPTRDELYFIDSSGTTIRKIDFVSRRVITIAGKSTTGGTLADGGLATDSSIKVNCFTMDESGNVFFTDGARLRIINQTDSRIYSLTSSNAKFSPDGTEFSSLSLSPSSCVLAARMGVIYLLEDKSIRKIQPTCEKGFILNELGTECQQCESGLTNNEDYTQCIPSCFGNIELSACSQNGKCISHDTCKCNAGWSGIDCSQTTCYGISNADTANVCSGRGKCIRNDTCVCSDRFKGKSCELTYWKDSEFQIESDKTAYVFLKDRPFITVRFNTTYQRPITLKLECLLLDSTSLVPVFKNLTLQNMTITHNFPTINRWEFHYFIATVFDQETGIQISNSKIRAATIISCDSCVVAIPNELTLRYANTRPNLGESNRISASFVFGLNYLFTFEFIFKFNNVTIYNQSITSVYGNAQVDIPPISIGNGILTSLVSLYGQPFYKNSSYLMISKSLNVNYKTQELFIEDNWISLKFSSEKVYFKSLSPIPALQLSITNPDFLSLFKDRELTANVTMYLIDNYGNTRIPVYSGNLTFIGGRNSLLSEIQVPQQALSMNSELKLEGFVTIFYNDTRVSNERKTIAPMQFMCENTYFGPNCNVTSCNGVYSNVSNICSGNGLCRNGYCSCDVKFKGNNCEMMTLKSTSVITQIDSSLKIKDFGQLVNFTVSINASVPNLEFLKNYNQRTITVLIYTQSDIYLDVLTLDRSNNFANSFKIHDNLNPGNYSFRLLFTSSYVFILDETYFYPKLIYTVTQLNPSISSPNPIKSTSPNNNSSQPIGSLSGKGGNRESSLSEGNHGVEFMGIIWLVILLLNFITFI